MKKLLPALALLASLGSVYLPVNAAGTAADAIALVIDLGGNVEFDSSTQGSVVTKVDLSRTKITDEQLGALLAFPELKDLDLRLTGITDLGVAKLQSLHGLRTLNLFRTPVTDSGLATLSGLTSLETLLIGGTRITDQGMAALLPLTSLVKVSIFDTKVGDEGALLLTSLAQLRVLLLDKSLVTESGRDRILVAKPDISFAESIT